MAELTISDAARQAGMALLEQHRAAVLAQMAEVQESLDRIDTKIAHYKEQLA